MLVPPVMRCTPAVAAWAVAALLATSAHAEDDLTVAQSTPNTQLPPVVVVGTTPLQSTGTPLANVPANVQIGTGKQIDAQRSLNLGEFLDNNLGSINSSNSVGNPYQMDVSYRGFTASPILGTAIGLSVFLDGVRINEAFGDVVNWDLIPTNAIDRIELIPGSNPLYGLNTLGGAIVVNTKNGADYPGLKATLYGGSWGRRAFEAEFGGVDEAHGIDYYLATNFFHEDGHRDWNRSNVNQLYTKERWHDTESTLELSLALADNTMYSTSVLPLSMLNNPTQAYTAPDYNIDRNTLIEIKGSHSVSDSQLLEGNLYYRVSNITGANSNVSCDDSVTAPENCVARQSTGDLDASNVISTTDQRGMGGSAQLTLSGDLAGHKNRLTVGGSIDASKVAYDSTTYGANLIGEVVYNIDPSGSNAINQTGSNPYFQGNTNLTTHSNYYGIFATDNFAFDEHWNLTLSGRYNYATVDLEGASVDAGNNPIGSLNGNHSYHRLNPAIGLNFNPTRELGFYASYSEGMRVPSPIELSCANPAIPCALPTGFTSDPNLEMIVSKTWEAGARGRFSPSAGWDFAVYDTTNQNDIQFIATGANNGATGFFQNVGKTERKGIELGVHGKLENLTLAAHYGYVDATYDSSFTEASPQNSTADANGNITVNKGDRIPGIARQTLKLRASYDLPAGWSVGASMIATSGQYAHGDENNRDKNGMLAGYALFNLDAHYQVSTHWQVFAKVTNVFDKDYHTFGILSQNMHTAQNELAVIPAVPRGIWVGVTYQFGGRNAASADVD